MARSQNVWGIDIGKCALKALRCSRSPDGETLVAESFDYVEYPMLLTQPEADPGELVRDAVEEFCMPTRFFIDLSLHKRPRA